MKPPKKSMVAVAMLLAIIMGGTIGYMLLEDYSFFQGLYMSAITISTVGYGEVVPLSPRGQLFSIILICCSIVGLAFATRALGESLLENTWSGRSEKRKMQRKIHSLKGHHIICGYGRVGHAAVKQLATAKAAFVVIDQVRTLEADPSEIDFPFIKGDATREQTLLDAGIKTAKGLLALLGSDPENVFLVLTARELNPTLRIIARANDPSVENKLHRAGADRVISPFTTAGTQVANELLLATGHQDDTCTDSHSLAVPQWISLNNDDPVVGTRVALAADKLGCAILGLRRGRKDRLMPAEDEKLKAGDSMLVLASPTDADDSQNDSPINKDVVIIDDNPVITKLYTRLFQKAGFIPHTAADGGTGLELIKKMHPMVAVIDFMMPVLSGIEICSKIREDQHLDGTRLILFTADDNIATRTRAMDAGADAVVVKSPDAQEVIKTVLDIISKS